MIKPSKTDPGKWGSVFDAEVSKATKKNTWFPMRDQKPKTKVNGKWVEK